MAMQTVMHAVLYMQTVPYQSGAIGSCSLWGHVEDYYQSLEAVLSSSHIPQPL